MALEPRVNPLRLDADRSTASDARMMQLTPLAGSVDRVAADAGVLSALGDGQPGPHGPSVQARRPRALKQVVMRIYEPRRAGDGTGAVLVVGADADMMPASDHVDIGARGVGADLSDRRCPTRSRRVLAI